MQGNMRRKTSAKFVDSSICRLLRFCMFPDEQWTSSAIIMEKLRVVDHTELDV